MNRSLKIFWACGIGAFIGTIVALQLGDYFWWAGMLVGGFVGYLSYEFKKVIQAVPKAFRAATSWKLNPTGSGLFWKAIGLVLVTGFLIGLWCLFFVSGIVLLAPHHSISYEDFTQIILPPSCVIWVLFSGTGLTVGVLMDFRRESSLESAVKNYVNIIGTANPFRVAKAFTFWLVRSVAKAIKVTPAIPAALFRASTVVGKFLKHLFVLIHSDERLLCGTDAALGTIIGYLSGNAIIGLLAGGILGVVNYEVVSKRILKVRTRTT